MPVQPDPNATNIAWAVQRELDGLRNDTDQHVLNLNTKIDKTVTQTEYAADKRLLDLKFSTVNDKIAEVDKAQKEDMRERRVQFRWLISAILIPISLTVMELLLNKK